MPSQYNYTPPVLMQEVVYWLFELCACNLVVSSLFPHASATHKRE